MNLILADAYIKLKDMIIRLDNWESQVTFNGSHYIVDVRDREGKATITKIPIAQVLTLKPQDSINNLEHDKVYHVIFNAETKEVFILWLTLEQFGIERIPKYVV